MIPLRFLNADSSRPAFIGRTAGCCRVGILMAGLLGAQIAHGAEPNPLAPSHRQPVDVSSRPWSALGKLYNGSGGGCTAAVIAPDEAVTAAHCLFGARTGLLLEPDSLHLLLGFARGEYRLDAHVQSYRIGAGYDHGRPLETLGADWAVLRLGTPLPPEYHPAPLARETPAAGTPVMTGGFGRDRAFMLTVDIDCRVLRPINSGRLLAHDCRAMKGYSGAPLLRWSDGNEQAEIVAIHVATALIKGEPVMIAVPASSIRRELANESPTGFPPDDPVLLYCRIF